MLVVELSNWCGVEPIIGADIAIPARRPGGPPMTHQVLAAEITEKPPCIDRTDPAQMTASAAP